MFDIACNIVFCDVKKMDMIQFQRIKRNIIKKLRGGGCFGKGHLLIIRLKKGIRKEDIPHIKKVLKQLIREDLVLAKKTKHGLAVHLNLHKLGEIDNIIDEES